MKTWMTLCLFFCFGFSVAHEGHGVVREPGMAIGAAFSPAGRLWVVGVKAPGFLFVQTSDDLGVHWSVPRHLNIGTDNPVADGENRPKIAFGPNGWVVITYTQPLARPYTGEIRMLRSSDGGAIFSAPFTVHHDRQQITHRFESVAFDRSGVLHTLWIDKRDLVASGGKPGYRGAAIYRNESRDGGVTFGPDLKLADHSCECCRIAMTLSADGGVAALWRHVFTNDERDHAFAALGRPASDPVRATFDHWRLGACPHHGPGLAPATDGGYHAVWFGERAGKVSVRYGRLTEDGIPAGTVREVPDLHAEHADVVASDHRVAIVWRSFDGVSTWLRAWVSNDDGAHFQLRALGSTSLDNDQPRLLDAKGQLFALWRTREGVQVIHVQP